MGAEMTEVAAVFASLAGLFAAAVVGAFLWITRPSKCPRCGGDEWVPLPHLGSYSAYCRKCTLQVDMATGNLEESA